MSYIDEIQRDSPNLWWRFREASLNFIDEIGGLVLSKLVTDSKPTPTQIRDTPILNDSSSRSVYFNANSASLWNGVFHPNYDVTRQFSWSFWIRPDDLTQNVSSYFVLGPGGSGTDWLCFYFRDIGKSTIGISTGGGQTQSFSLDQGYFQQGQWHHVVYTHSATDEAKLYINKVLVATGLHTDPINTSNDFYINHSNFINDGDISKGAVTEVLAFPSVLTQQRVDAHYDSARQAGPPQPVTTYRDLILSHNPILFYEFNEQDASTVALDETSNHNNGQFVVDLEFQQPGIIADNKTSIYFNGGNVNVPVTPVRALKYCSIETWIHTISAIGSDNRIWDFNNGEVGTTTSKYVYLAWNYKGTNSLGVEFSPSGPGTETHLFSRNVFPGEKVHVVVTFLQDVSDPTKYKSNLYVNGIHSGTTPLVSYDMSEIFSSVQAAWISKSPLGVSTNYKGRQDEFAIYDYVLDDDRIVEHYQAGITPGPPPIKTASISESIAFQELIDTQLIPPGAGRVFEITVSDQLTFGESTGGSPPPTQVKDTLNFIDQVIGEARPFHAETKDQLIFVDAIHGSPFRVTLTDTLTFVESFRPNLYKMTVSDKLTFSQTVGHNWKLEPTGDTLNFSQTIVAQNNHQYISDTLVFDEQIGIRQTITNKIVQDQLVFIESPSLRYSIAHITVSDVLVFQDQIHRVLSGAINDNLVFIESSFRVHPSQTNDTLVFVETIDAQASKYVADILTFFEVFCVQSNLTRGMTDNLGFNESFTFLINGPDDPRNGGGSPGGSGVSVNAVYRKTLNDRLTFKEFIVTDPAGSDKECIVDVSSQSNITFIESMVYQSDNGIELRYALRFSSPVTINDVPMNIKIKRVRTGFLASPIAVEQETGHDDSENQHRITLVYGSSFDPPAAVANEWNVSGPVSGNILFPQSGRIEGVPTYIMSVHDIDGEETRWTFSSKITQIGAIEAGTFEIYDSTSSSWFGSDGPATQLSPTSLSMPNLATRPLTGWRVNDPPTTILFETGLVVPEEGDVT